MSTIQNIVNRTSEICLHSATAAGIGYLFARSLVCLNPLHAAAISAISVLIAKITNPLFQKCFGGPEANGSSLLFGSVLNITVSVAATISAANAIGFSISVPAFLYLNAVAIGTYVLANLGVLAASAEMVGLETSFLR